MIVEDLAARPGDRVALLLPSHWQSVVWYLACWTAGVVAAPDADSPILPGLPNRTVALLAGAATFLFFPPGLEPVPFYHFTGGQFDANGLPTALSFTPESQWISFLRAGAPYEPVKVLLDSDRLICNQEDVPFDDHWPNSCEKCLYHFLPVFDCSRDWNRAGWSSMSSLMVRNRSYDTDHRVHPVIDRVSLQVPLPAGRTEFLSQGGRRNQAAQRCFQCTDVTRLDDASSVPAGEAGQVHRDVELDAARLARCQLDAGAVAPTEALAVEDAGTDAPRIRFRHEGLLLAHALRLALE